MTDWTHEQERRFAAQWSTEAMTDTDDLVALAERCEAASGPDHVLDAHIVCALRGYTIHEETDPSKGYFAFWDGKPWKSICHNTGSWPDYTASLDAALALLGEKLPGWGATVTMALDGSGHATVFDATGQEIDQNGLTKRDGASDWIDHHKNAAAPALALCATLLRALAATRKDTP